MNEEFERIVKGLTEGGLKRVETEHMTGYWMGAIGQANIRVDIRGVSGPSALEIAGEYTARDAEIREQFTTEKLGGLSASSDPRTLKEVAADVAARDREDSRGAPW